VFHASLLTPYHETTIHGPNYHNPPPDVINGEQEWEVEKIIGSRTFGRKKELQYRIKWKGYSHAHESWEPATNIHAPKLVQAYLKKTKQRLKRTRMSNEPLPSHLNIIAMDPATTTPLSPPVSPPISPIGLTERDLDEIATALRENRYPGDHIMLALENIPTRDIVNALDNRAFRSGNIVVPLTASEPPSDEEVITIPDSPPYVPRTPTPELEYLGTPLPPTYNAPKSPHHRLHHHFLFHH
jgi:hypothetical protein